MEPIQRDSEFPDIVTTTKENQEIHQENINLQTVLEKQSVNLQEIRTQYETLRVENAQEEKNRSDVNKEVTRTRELAASLWTLANCKQSLLARSRLLRARLHDACDITRSVICEAEAKCEALERERSRDRGRKQQELEQLAKEADEWAAAGANIPKYKVSELAEVAIAIETARKELEDAETQRRHLDNIKRQIEQDRAQIDQTYLDAKEELATNLMQYEAEKKSYTANIKMQDIEIAERERVNEIIRSAIEEQFKMAEAMKRDNACLQEEIPVLEDKKIDVIKILEGMSTECEKLGLEYENLLLTKIGYDKEMQHTAEKHDALKITLEGLTEEITSLHGIKQEKECEVTEKERLWAEEKAALVDSINDMKLQVTVQAATLEQREGERRDLLKNIAQLNQSLAENIEHHKSKINQLILIKKCTENELTSTETYNEELKVKIRTVNDNSETIKESIAKHISENEIIQKKQWETKLKLEVEEGELMKAKKAEEEAAQQLNLTEAHLNNIMRDNKDMDNNVVNKLDLWTEEKVTLMEAIEHVKQDYWSIEQKANKKIQDLEKKIPQLQDEINTEKISYEKYNSDMQMKINGIKQCLNNQTNEITQVMSDYKCNMDLQSEIETYNEQILKSIETQSFNFRDLKKDYTKAKNESKKKTHILQNLKRQVDAVTEDNATIREKLKIMSAKKTLPDTFQ